MGRRALFVLLAVAVVLLALRMALPYALERGLEYAIGQSEDYRGRIEHVDVALLRGVERAEGVVIEGVAGDAPLAVFEAEAVEIDVHWSSLLRGRVAADVRVEAPQVAMVAVPDEEDIPEEHWSAVLDTLFLPVDVERADVLGGRVRFLDRQADPQVDLAVTDLRVEARDLTTERERSGEFPSTVEASGVVFGSGELEADMKLDPLAYEPAFRLAAQMEGLDLTAVNDYTQAYLGMDVHRGWAAVYLEVRASGGRFRGSVKPMVQGLDVLGPGEAGEQGALETAKEALTGAVAESLEWQEEDRQAAQVSVRGRFEDPQVGVLEAVESVLRHAFVEAIQPGFANLLGVETEIEDGAAGGGEASVPAPD